MKIIVLKTTEEKVNKDLLKKFEQFYEICGDVVVKVDQTEKVKIYIPMKLIEV